MRNYEIVKNSELIFSARTTDECWSAIREGVTGQKLSGILPPGVKIERDLRPRENVNGLPVKLIAAVPAGDGNSWQVVGLHPTVGQSFFLVSSFGVPTADHDAARFSAAQIARSLGVPVNLAIDLNTSSASVDLRRLRMEQGLPVGRNGAVE